ncbi:radical SAM protein [Desulfocurvibacter africanus]|uniref:FeMo cofactor biosynthesis protein NifB n=1 Tax=Desulfocurvibacter africanus subsp. africanus str. Walvis Bay TaxID=690850 RepID=F3YWU7_DESAF|nr:radical SAM protein [Desulfocurvibacter africanus]EGJ51671.1 Radical SAM domain protein [Desulfocurvibacter africanus subsp. africanus str. Walvis Bay]
MPTGIQPDRGAERHPCFHAAAKGRYGRIHLPVAPACNIRCGYCDRRHDCVSESRPGVTSRLMAPEQASAHLQDALARMPFISVAGIAGPGDPFCRPELTLETLRRVRQICPEIILCVSSNGLNLPGHVDDLAELGVGFVTVTVNAVDPDVGARIYRHVLDGRRLLRGHEAAALLLARQAEAVAKLKARGVTVKVNCVVVPGVNDGHVPEVARWAADLGADIMNCIGLIPVPGTPLGDRPAPSATLLESLRREAGKYLPQMRHCARCRADAEGLLDEVPGACGVHACATVPA